MTESLSARPAIAVALQGRIAVGQPGPTGEDRQDLPQLIASGRGALAEQILALAFANGVKVRQDADLAELLATLDLDTPIPPEAIVAVGEILEQVFAANRSLAQAPATGDTGA